MPNVEELASALAEDSWVAEDAVEHLMPHIRASCEEPRSMVRVTDVSVRDAILVVDLVWVDVGAPRPDSMRSEVFRIVGSFAEQTTQVRQRSIDGAGEFEIATGTTAVADAFRSHGHLVRMRVRSTC